MRNIKFIYLVPLSLPHLQSVIGLEVGWSVDDLQHAVGKRHRFLRIVLQVWVFSGLQFVNGLAAGEGQLAVSKDTTVVSAVMRVRDIGPWNA